MEKISEMKGKHAVGRGLWPRRPSNWPRVKLGEVCGFRRGLTYSKNDEVASSSIAVLRSNNVELETGKLNLGELKYLRDDFELPPEKIVVRGSILMCMANGSKAHLGKVAIIDIEDQFAFGGFMGLLIPDIERILSSYLYWVLTSYEFKQLIAGLTDGANINNLKFSDIALFELPLPPLSVQREIVARLEKELAAVERMEKGFEAIKAEADQLFKSTLKEIGLYERDWPLEPLKNHVDVLAGYAFKSDDFSGDGVKICGGLIIMPDRIKWEECKYLSNPIGYEQFLLNEGDIVLALDRPWISSGFKMGRIKKTDLPCLLIQRTARLRVIDMDRGFLSIALLHEDFRDHCTTSGATVPHISHKDIESYLVPIPPLPTQREIVAKLDAVRERCEKLKRAAEEGLQTAALMRKAILKEAFA